MRTFMACLVVSAALTAYGQTPQLPTLQVCNATKVGGGGVVAIASRAATGIAGTFTLRVPGIGCDPAVGYPTGNFTLSIDMNDGLRGTIVASSLEQVTSTGRVTPTAFMNGRCKSDKEPIAGCRFWIMIADNKKAEAKGTPDVVSFLVIDSTGKRVAYGTGPLREGDLVVAPTSN